MSAASFPPRPAAQERDQPPVTPEAERFSAAGLVGEIDRRFVVDDLAAELSSLLDPASAVRTLHWGRNYLYVARWPRRRGVEDRRLEPDARAADARLERALEQPVEVVVKQFRHHSLKARWRRRRKGSKARRAWQAARSLADLGFSTPQPVLYAESPDLAGPAYYVCRYLQDPLEVRYPLRALNGPEAQRDLGPLDGDVLIRALGRLARRLHDRGVWFRDFTSGNVLIESGGAERANPPGAVGQAAAVEALADRMSLVDLGRARFGRDPTLSERMRDLSRMPLHRSELRRTFLDAYWQPAPPAPKRRLGDRLYVLHHWSFRFRHRSKRGVRSRLRRIQDVLLPRRRPHAHIPAAERGVSARDKVVWDRLSDQPHQHAGRLEKLRVRIADLPAHSHGLLIAAGALRRARRRQRELIAGLHRQPVTFGGLGVGVRPVAAAGEPGAAEGLLSAIADLGVRCVLLRTHPWADDVEAEVALARELATRGLEVTVALPQNRDLVRDPARWRAAIAERVERLAPFARHYQIGQAINRSKWGVWRPGEYVALFRAAAEEIRARRSDAELLGPAVIDFEPHATATLLALPEEGLEFDALASLLYVDRRGAPENRQMGFDAVGKAALLKALAETSRNCPSGRSWITEVNWPLREGPHSPAGRDVAVREEEQASYLVRYCIGIGAAGLAERIFWWQLAAKGYGLVDPLADPLAAGGSWRRRPAFAALATLQRLLDGARSFGPVGITAEGERLYRFEDRAGREILVGWCLAGRRRLDLPHPVARVVERDGQERAGSGRGVEIDEAPRYFVLG